MSNISSSSKLPVGSVLWKDAVEYCNKKSINEGLSPCYKSIGKGKYECDFSANGYRLPTDAEWEFAASGGNKSKGYIYSGSNTSETVAWNEQNSGSRTHEVMTKKPNELGIYDMSGNDCKTSISAYTYADAEFTFPPIGFRVVRSTMIAKDKTMSAVYNLKLRTDESIDSEVKTIMQAGTTVKILEFGKSETIDDIRSNWVKVEVISGRDRDGKDIKKKTTGWCYGGYLE